MSSVLPRLLLGRVPTPVRRVELLSDGQAELWVKDDGWLHPLYGGNKIRKLEYLLGPLTLRRPARIVTVGSASSHHVLATSIIAAELGVRVLAVLCPHPRSQHSEKVLRAILDSGVEVRAVGSMAAVPVEIGRSLRPGDLLIGPGGSSARGSMGYLNAAAELSRQISAGVLPEPDVVVVALGSGGTAAGLAAGLLSHGLKSRVVGVLVVGSARVAKAQALQLAARLLIHRGESRLCLQLPSRFTVAADQLGAGYGFPTRASLHAAAEAARIGLTVDPTYTAKALAGALQLLESARVSCRSAGKLTGPTSPGPGERPLRVLYWHTLSSVMPGGGALRTGNQVDSRSDLTERLLGPRSGV